ncbi:MAG: septal ring lytic transglycosylase RlpA family protein [Alphaproteobacteria bacterium]|nr:MAG: septal ring lytic transglycosylase RlpA family protein [Alphaproteobacteria bacterium]
MVRLFVFLLAFLLSGCTNQLFFLSERIDAKQVAKAQTYNIKNSHGHFTVQSKEDYHLDEYGLASYYGMDFHDRLTALGIKYDQLDMVAAHPTIPLPAVLKVTKVKTGEFIYVLAVDRGPFVKKGKKRVIDLSVGAARALKFEKEGVTLVRVQCLVKQSERLRKEWKKHVKDKKIPYNLVKGYCRRVYVW